MVVIVVVVLVEFDSLKSFLHSQQTDAVHENGTLCLVPGTWYQVPGFCHLVPGTPRYAQVALLFWGSLINGNSSR